MDSVPFAEGHSYPYGAAVITVRTKAAQFGVVGT